MTDSPTKRDRLFIHLRVHSAYSLLEGALPVGKVVGHATKTARRPLRSPTRTTSSVRWNSRNTR
jgi:hypothetical protein